MSGNLTAAAIIALKPPVLVKTVEGQPFLVTIDGDNLKVNDATVIIPNVFATNGIIHAIDTVLLPPSQLKDIVDTAVANGNFKTLVTALQVADLVPVLKSRGPFTVFAPTDAAFAKLPPGTVENLLKPENRRLLIRILTYHVVSGNLTAAAIIALKPPVNVTTIEGQDFLVTQSGNNLKVNDATVIIPNVFASNGIIHAIDTVLLPPAELPDIVDTAIQNGNFKTLVTALQVAGLVPVLKSRGPFTVFAPTDAAFAKLPPGTVENLLKPENRRQLISILLYHVVPGNLTAAAIIALNPPVNVKTLDGQTFLVTIVGNNLKVNDATVIIPNVFASNGIIHVLDTVLLPPQRHEMRRQKFISKKY